MAAEAAGEHGVVDGGGAIEAADEEGAEGGGGDEAAAVCAAAEGGKAHGVGFLLEDFEVAEEKFRDNDEEARRTEFFHGAEDFESGDEVRGEGDGKDGEIGADEEEDGNARAAPPEGDGGDGKGKGQDVGGFAEEDGERRAREKDEGQG